jgi:hypothetical protein
MTTKSKRVRITLEVDATFVRLLHTNLNMKRGALKGERELDVLTALGVVAFCEMRGAKSEVAHAITPIKWRPHIEAVYEARRWQGSDGEWHVTEEA